jgi:hypothetical protein
MDHEWEYCTLRKSTTWATVPGASNSLRITYHGALSASHDLPPQDWDRALGLLGRAGWELVSVTAIHTVGERANNSTDTAYFKRPAHKRRAVDQPPLVL